MSSVPSKLELLMAIFEPQKRAARLMLESDALKNAGKLREAVPAYDQLIAALEKQLELAELNNQHYADSPFEVQPIVSQLVDALLTQADVIEALGDLQKAESVRERALCLSEKYLSPVDAAERQRQRADSLIPQGRFNEALVALAGARDLFAQRGEKLLTANVTATIAGILEWLGDFERARAEVRRALDLIGPLPRELAGGDFKRAMVDVLGQLAGGDFKRAEEEVRIMAIVTNLQQLEARVNRRLGNFDEAEKQFRAVAPRLPPDIAEAGIGFHLAAIWIDQGRYQEGLEYLARIEPYFTGLVRPKLGALLGYKAEALLGLKRAQEALAVAERACSELRRYRDPDSLWKSEWRQGRALAALGRRKRALTAFVQAANTINQLRKAPLGYRLDSTYLKDKLPVFVDAIGLAAAMGDGETCCSLIELVKSRALTATLSVPVRPQAGETELDRQLDELSCRLDALEYKSYAEGGTDEIEQERPQLQEQRVSLLERRRFSDPRWRSLSEPVPFDLKALLKLLVERNQAALSLFIHRDQVTSVLLADSRCEVARTQLSASTQAALTAYQTNLQAEEPKPSCFDPSGGLKLAAEQLVPATLLERAVAAKSLVVAPHGALHLIPWAGLVFRGKRLFEYLPVGILPNLSCVNALQAQLSKSPRIALIGDPDYSALPSIRPLALARDEIETIAGVYRERGALIGEAYVGKAATEERFWLLARNEAAAGGILHVVCHGDFVTGDPMSSGLLLTDGRVDATELVRRRLSYDEVILSACATGRRPTEVQGIALTGDDIVGLPGALLEAGARSVLTSIPAARDDAARQFMTIYHDRRVEGSAPLVALQKTQLEMLASPLYEPQLWVGFTVYGCQ
jgi:CHAT domain-containing protein/predicted negative regulator of RcsB-dependent stress response